MTLGEIINCKFHAFGITEELRKKLANGRFNPDEVSPELGVHDWGVAVLELGNVDIELNVTVQEDDPEAIVYPDYFICVKCGDGEDDWGSFGYADDYIGDAGRAHVDWSAENWKEQLFADMLKALTMFMAEANKHSFNLKYLTVNDYI